MGTSAIPALAKGTADIEPTGRVERAATTRLRTLAPWMQDKAEPGPETLPQEGKPEL